MSEQPPAPGYWKASDGNWYPPESLPTTPTPQAPQAPIPPGPGYWQATDGNWYPPESAPTPSTPTPTQQPQNAWSTPAQQQPSAQNFNQFQQPASTMVQAEPKKKRRWPWVVGIILVLVVIGAAVSGGGDDDDSNNGDTTPDTDQTDTDQTNAAEEVAADVDEEPAPEEPEAAAPAAGATRDNPAPLGTAAATGSGWSVTVNSFIPDANAVVADANMFNTTPEPGNVYVIVNVTAAYQGDDDDAGNETRSGMDINMKVLGADGQARSSAIMVTIDNEISAIDEVYSGGALTGNLVFEIPSDQVDSLVLVAEPTFSFSNDKSFHALR